MSIMILTQYSFEIYHANDGKSMRTNLVMLAGNVTHRQQCGLRWKYQIKMFRNYLVLEAGTDVVIQSRAPFIKHCCQQVSH